MNNAETLLEGLKPELLKILSTSPDYGSIGINIVLHDKIPVRIDSNRTVTIKVVKGGSKWLPL